MMRGGDEGVMRGGYEGVMRRNGLRNTDLVTSRNLNVESSWSKINQARIHTSHFIKSISR